MTHKIHTPTADFAYVESEIYPPTAGLSSIPDPSIEEQIEEHVRIVEIAKYKVGEGLPDKDWRRVIDNYIHGDHTMKAEEFDAMNANQQFMVKQYKLSKSRANPRPLKRPSEMEIPGPGKGENGDYSGMD